MGQGVCGQLLPEQTSRGVIVGLVMEQPVDGMIRRAGLALGGAPIDVDGWRAQRFADSRDGGANGRKAVRGATRTPAADGVAPKRSSSAASADARLLGGDGQRTGSRAIDAC